MKRIWLVLAVVSLLIGCSSVPSPRVADPVQEAKAPQVTVMAPLEPAVRLEAGRIILPEGLSGAIPQEAYAVGSMILLQGVQEEVVNISFSDCPKGAPDIGCVGNHRGIKVSGTATVAGTSVSRYEADFQKNSAAADSRTWLELHTITRLPSGRRIDVVGQMLSGSGKEALLRSVYESLLSSLGKS